MPTNPTVLDVHIDVALTNISVAYLQQPSVFVADKVFPVVPVSNRSDKYWKFNKDDFLRAGGDRTPYGTEAHGGGWNLSTDSYLCETRRWKFDITPDLRANSDAAINLDMSVTNYVTNSLLIQREVDWATKYFQTGIWGTDLTGVASAPTTGQFIQWNDQVNSNPIADIKAQKTAILVATGQKPNTMVVSQYVHDALTQHPMILDRYKYTSSDSITPEMLARLFEVQRYMISEAVQVTSQEGQTITTAFILSKSVLLCYVNPAPALMMPSSGYVFTWSGLTGLNNLGVRTARIPMNWLGVGTERVEGEYSYDMKLVGGDLGVFFSNAVA